MKISPRSDRAFTLIEIMVALGLLAVIVAAIYSTWTAVARGAQAGKAAAAAAQRSRVAIQALEGALSTARSFDADVQYYGFVGENGSEATLSFAAWLPGSFLRHGKFQGFDVRRVTFSLEPGPDSSKQLVMRQNPILMEMDKEEQDHPIVLANNVKDFIMEFNDGRSADPLDEWTQTNQLPKSVKITLRIGGDDPRSSRIVQEITREVALPSVSVQRGWQMPGALGGGGLQQLNPPGAQQ